MENENIGDKLRTWTPLKSDQRRINTQWTWHDEIPLGGEDLDITIFYNSEAGDIELGQNENTIYLSWSKLKQLIEQLEDLQKEVVR